MWRLGYYRGITWRMLLNSGRRMVALNGPEHVSWQWTDFFLGDNYNPMECHGVVEEKVPHGYIWAIAKDPAYETKPSILGTLLKKGRGSSKKYFTYRSTPNDT